MLHQLPTDALYLITIKLIQYDLKPVASQSKEQQETYARDDGSGSEARQTPGPRTKLEAVLYEAHDEQAQEFKDLGLFLDSRSLSLLVPLMQTCKVIRQQLCNLVKALAIRDHGYINREDILLSATQFPDLATLDLSVMFSTVFSSPSPGNTLKLSSSLGMFTMINNKCPKIKRLILSGTSSLPIGLGAELAKWEHLEDLDISSCFMRNNVLQGLEKSKSLLTLDIANCAKDEFYEQFFRDTLPKMTSLAKLYVQGGGNGCLNDRVLACMRPLQRLCVLDIESCHEITDEGLFVLAPHLPNLQVLSLADCPQLGDKALEACGYFPKLIKLIASFNYRMTTNGFRRWLATRRNLAASNPGDDTPQIVTSDASGRTAPCLRTIEIADCTELAPDIIAALPEFTHLKNVELNALVGLVDASALAYCEQITSLDLSFCVKLSSKSIQAFAGLPNLEDLTLQCCINMDRDACIAISRCAALESLDIASCKNLGSLELSLFACLPKLQYIRMDEIPAVDDAVVEEYSRHSKNLKSISLSGCENFTQLKWCLMIPQIQSIHTDHCNLVNLHPGDLPESLNCPVRVLNIKGNAAIDDAGIRVLASHCKMVRKLDCSKLSRLTDQGLDCISSSMQAIKYLSVCQCPLLTQQGVLLVASRLEQLESIDVNYLRIISGVQMKEYASLHDARCGPILSYYLQNGGDSEQYRKYHYNRSLGRKLQIATEELSRAGGHSQQESKTKGKGLGFMQVFSRFRKPKP